MNIYAEIKITGRLIKLPDSFGIGKRNAFTDGVLAGSGSPLAGNEINPRKIGSEFVHHCWTNPHIKSKAAKQIGVKPRQIACVFETH